MGKSSSIKSGVPVRDVPQPEGEQSLPPADSNSSPPDPVRVTAEAGLPQVLRSGDRPLARSILVQPHPADAKAGEPKVPPEISRIRQAVYGTPFANWIHPILTFGLFGFASHPDAVKVALRDLTVLLEDDPGKGVLALAALSPRLRTNERRAALSLMAREARNVSEDVRADVVRALMLFRPCVAGRVVATFYDGLIQGITEDPSSLVQKTWSDVLKAHLEPGTLAEDFQRQLSALIRQQELEKVIVLAAVYPPVAEFLAETIDIVVDRYLQSAGGGGGGSRRKISPVINGRRMAQQVKDHLAGSLPVVKTVPAVPHIDDSNLGRMSVSYKTPSDTLTVTIGLAFKKVRFPVARLMLPRPAPARIVSGHFLEVSAPGPHQPLWHHAAVRAQVRFWSGGVPNRLLPVGR